MKFESMPDNKTGYDTANVVTPATRLKQEVLAGNEEAKRLFEKANNDIKRFFASYGYADDLRNRLTSESNTPQHIVEITNEILAKIEEAKESFILISTPETETKFYNILALSLKEIDRMLTEKRVKPEDGRELIDARIKKIMPQINNMKK